MYDNMISLSHKEKSKVLSHHGSKKKIVQNIDNDWCKNDTLLTLTGQLEH